MKMNKLQAERALRECAKDLGYEPSAEEYEKWAQTVRPPGLGWIAIHFDGGWKELQRRVGHTPKQPGRPRKIP